MSDSILCRALTEHVVELRLNRPDRLNALSVAMVAQLRQLVDELAHSSVRVVLISGEGRAFCAGADLKERAAMDLAARLAHNAGINAAIDALENARFVSVAVLHGVAVGGGLELALGCTLRIASDAARLGLTESRLGALPGAGGTQRLPRVVGTGAALHLMLTAEPVSGTRAYDIGLVNDVCESGELAARAEALAIQVASRSPRSLRRIRQLVADGMTLSLSDALRMERAVLPEVLGSADYAEGLAAFAERRAPRFADWNG